jgi:hypothetical protein
MSDDSDRDGSGRKMVGRAWTTLTWGNRIRTLWGWLFAGGTANTVIGAGTAGLVGISVAALVGDYRASRQAEERLAGLIEASSAAPAPRQELGQEAVVYSVRGRDKAGRWAEFDVIVLARDFYWVKGSTELMERAGAKLDGEAFKRTLTEKELGARVAMAADLIAVGLASAEGERATEEARAAERGRRIGTWLKEATGGRKTVWTLNLGQYQQAATPAVEETDWQRPILLIGLRSAQAGVEVGEALAFAMNATPNLPKTARYTRFDLQKAN